MDRNFEHLTSEGSGTQYFEMSSFLATVVALHFTPVSESVGRSFGLAYLGACEIVYIIPTKCGYKRPKLAMGSCGGVKNV